MQTMMTIKGQVTIPKRVRDELGLKPGRPVDFDINSAGEVVIRKSRAKQRRPDRFDKAVGAATIKWKSTQEVMSILRPED